MEKKKSAKKKPKKWCKPRHAFFIGFGRIFVYPVIRFVYGCRVCRYREQGKRPYLILYNHQTPIDQFFVAFVFRGATYFVATEDIFSLGFLSSLLRYSVAPIPIKKATTDVRAVIDCIKVAREGGSIAIAPEGNRTYTGKTCYIKPTVVPLAKKLGLPIAFVRIEDGFGVCPRFSDVKRKGKMRAYVSDVLEPEVYGQMSDDELYAKICDELKTDESASGGVFRHKRRAEYLERLFYTCPVCGVTEWHSHGNTATCKKCGMTFTYGEDKTLSGEGFPYRTVGEFYDAQEAFVHGLTLDAFLEKPAAVDTVRHFRVVPYKKKVRLAKNAALSLFSDRIEADYGEVTHVYRFADMTGAAVMGRNKLNMYHKDEIYQFKGDKRFNALKFVNFYYHHSAKEGHNHGEFLGL